MKFSDILVVTIVFLTLINNTSTKLRKKTTTKAPSQEAVTVPAPVDTVTVPAPDPAVTVPAPDPAVTVPAPDPAVTVPAPKPDATVPAPDPAVTVPAPDKDAGSATVPTRSVDDPNVDALANSASVVGDPKADLTAQAAAVAAANSTVSEDEMEAIWSMPSDAKVPKGAKIPTQRLGQTRFVVFRKRANWFRSHEQCRRHGMNLATFPTEQVYDEVVKIIFGMSVFDLTAKAEWLGGRRYWIGLNDLSGEGDWRWVDTGDRLNYTTKWYVPPEHPGEQEHCGVLWNPNFEKGMTHTLDDSDCTGPKRGYYFICEHYKEVPRNY